MPAHIAFLGELAALGTAACWTVSAVNFEAASKRCGSTGVNIIRLVLAVVFLGFFNLATRGQIVPTDANPVQWLWLCASGIIGFTLGDLCLFEAFVRIGSRVSMLVMALAPALTAIMGFFFLGEVLSIQAVIGIVLTMAGIALVVLKPTEGALKLNQPVAGLLLAFGGALGQAGGLILSKIGMRGDSGANYPATSSAQIRAMAGVVGFALLYTLMRSWPKVASAAKDRKGMAFATAGAVAGPFIGVSLSLVAVANAQAGVASSIMSITPVLIIPVAFFVFKEKIKLVEIVGAALAVGGVVCMFL